MRRAKKAFALSVVILLLLSLTACGTKDPIVGRWVATQRYYDSQIRDIEPTEDISYFVFKKDGTGTMAYSGAEESAILWSFKGESSNGMYVYGVSYADTPSFAWEVSIGVSEDHLFYGKLINAITSDAALIYEKE